MEAGTEDAELRHCRLKIADCRLRFQIGNRQLAIGNKGNCYADENWNTDARLGWCD